MTEYFVAWWNLENLFDIQDSKDRPDWLQKTLKSELKGWTTAILKKKIQQLSSIILQMNGGRGPDLLGVCEVENKAVMDMLVASLKTAGRTYKVKHHDTSDQRGIDVGFIYDSKLLTAKEDFFHIILKRTATRDLYQVNFETKSGKTLVAIGNHWPSRSAGTLESEPYRILAGETLAYWNERIPKFLEKDIAVLVMGDFNDNPYNRSVLDYALATNVADKLKRARTPLLFNLMWPLMARGLGTHYYSGEVNVLDQFMVSAGVVSGKSGFSLLKSADGTPGVTIEMFPEMQTSKTNLAPKRFGRPSSKGFKGDGYSDHYPISVVIKEK